MYEKTTFLNNPDAPQEEPKKFAYDYSYWSHDGYKETETGLFVPDPSHANGHKYCDQVNIVLYSLFFYIMKSDLCKYKREFFGSN